MASYSFLELNETISLVFVLLGLAVLTWGKTLEGYSSIWKHIYVIGVIMTVGGALSILLHL